MGQYHRVFNLDKRQSLDPHKLGDGLKLAEHTGDGVQAATWLLLAACSGRGGGDFQSDDPLIGSWAGDRIAIIGDYAESDDVPGCNAAEVYDSEDYEDISEQMVSLVEREYEVVIAGSGWRTRVRLASVVEGWEASHGFGDRRARINGADYAMSDVVAAVKALPESRLTNCWRGEKLAVEELGIASKS